MWQLAFSRPVIRRGPDCAVAVGTILIEIPHGGAILRGAIDAVRWQTALTATIPCCLSALSSVAAPRDAGPAPEPRR